MNTVKAVKAGIFKGSADKLTAEKPKPVQRFERIFTIHHRYNGFALAFLRQVCRPDRQYPSNRINSLYFDTDDLDKYIRSASSEFKKDKIRIRWYDKPTEEDREVPVYLEVQ